MSKEEHLKNWNDRADWVQYGIDKGWCGDSYCATHDGGDKYWTDEEFEAWNEGGDPCQTVIRILGVD
jgi:hypothetical protein